MNIDPKTGNVYFRPSQLVLRRGLRDEEIQSVPQLPKMSEQEFPGGHRWYHFEVTSEDETICVFALHFLRGTLESITLCLASQTEKRTWASWSEANEMRRKEGHDAYLRRSLGEPPYVYPWGSIVSDYDAKSGFSAITITYAP